MMRALTVLFVAVLVTAALALFARAMPVQQQPSFAFVDVVVDSGSTPLAAWQVELVDGTKQASIVGIEGGEHAAFRDPPYHDRRALQKNRVVIAAFQTDGALPTGSTRVARVHYHTSGMSPVWHVQIVTAADADGRPIQAAVSIRN
jgi:hypothetical protein